MVTQIFLKEFSMPVAIRILLLLKKVRFLRKTSDFPWKIRFQWCLHELQSCPDFKRVFCHLNITCNEQNKVLRGLNTDATDRKRDFKKFFLSIFGGNSAEKRQEVFQKIRNYENVNFASTLQLKAPMVCSWYWWLSSSTVYHKISSAFLVCFRW